MDALIDQATNHVLADADLDPSFEAAADQVLADAVGEGAAEPEGPGAIAASISSGISSMAGSVEPGMPAPVAAAAAAAATGADTDAAPEADGVWSTNPVLQAYMEAHTAFSQKLAQHGYFETREHQADSLGMKEMGTLKRAWLNFTRSRPDVLFSLQAEAIAPLLMEPLPYEEGKVRLAPLLLVLPV